MQKTRSEEWVVTPNLLHLCFFLSCPDIGSRLFRNKQGIGAEKVHIEFTFWRSWSSSSPSRCVVKGVTGTCPRDPLKAKPESCTLRETRMNGFSNHKLPLHKRRNLLMTQKLYNFYLEQTIIFSKFVESCGPCRHKAALTAT